MYIQAFRPRDILFSLPVFIIDRTALSGPHFIFAGMVFRSGLDTCLFRWPRKGNEEFQDLSSHPEPHWAHPL